VELQPEFGRSVSRALVMNLMIGKPRDGGAHYHVMMSLRLIEDQLDVVGLNRPDELEQRVFDIAT